MKNALLGLAVLVLVAARPAMAGDIQNQPIDTKKLVVQPTRAVADLTAATINMAGQAAAGQVQGNGFVRTFNNLFRKPTPTTLQLGPSRLPSPTLFPSTQYKSYNMPVMPRLTSRPR